MRDTWLFILPRRKVVFFDHRTCVVETFVLSGLPDPPDLNYTWGLAFADVVSLEPRPERGVECGLPAQR